MKIWFDFSFRDTERRFAIFPHKSLQFNCLSIDEIVIYQLWIDALIIIKIQRNQREQKKKRKNYMFGMIFYTTIDDASTCLLSPLQTTYIVMECNNIFIEWATAVSKSVKWDFINCFFVRRQCCHYSEIFFVDFIIIPIPYSRGCWHLYEAWALKVM